MVNKFKLNLQENKLQIGLWCSLANTITTEIAAGAGFDWLLIDVEHSPNDLRSVLLQLQTVTGFPVEPVVRLPSSDPVVIQQYMDIGVRTMMIPDVRKASDAKSIVAATRYPPKGIRSISVSQRANQYGRVKDYHANSWQEICIVVQIESQEGVINSGEIAAVDGVDCLFIGPSDLSANIGQFMNPAAEQVQKAITNVLSSSRKNNKPVGILASKKDDASAYINNGLSMLAVGSDLSLFVNSCDQLAKHYKNQMN